MPRKVCDIKEHPELKTIVDDMNRTKESLLVRVEYYKQQALAAQKELTSIKDEAVELSKKNWKKVTDYLEKNGLLNEPIDEQSGETLSFTSDGGTLEIKNKTEALVEMMRIMLESATEDKQKVSNQDHSDELAKLAIPSKEYLN